MSTLKDFLDWLVELSKAMFKGFGTAVSDYPLPTIVVFVGVFYFLHANSLFTPYDDGNGRIKKSYSVSEFLSGSLDLLSQSFCQMFWDIYLTL
jgi:hypothetical protein